MVISRGFMFVFRERILSNRKRKIQRRMVVSLIYTNCLFYLSPELNSSTCSLLFWEGWLITAKISGNTRIIMWSWPRSLNILSVIRLFVKTLKVVRRLLLKEWESCLFLFLCLSQHLLSRVAIIECFERIFIIMKLHLTSPNTMLAYRTRWLNFAKWMLGNVGWNFRYIWPGLKDHCRTIIKLWS